ncbi:MAG: hypothetical protein ABI605_09195 [Rhizobacter sp.]
MDKWDNITPPMVSLPGPPSGAFGTNAFVLDPVNAGTIYLGTSQQGIYKSTNCGKTWEHINTGSQGICGGPGFQEPCPQALDSGRQWSFAIDPSDPKILYTANGFGGYSAGLLKSVDGGVNWAEIWPPKGGAAAVTGNIAGLPSFVGKFEYDPWNHLHLLVGFHEPCSSGHSSLCWVETYDGGDSWTVRDGSAGMSGYSPHDTSFYILDAPTHWLATMQDQIWRTANSGKTWQKLQYPDASYPAMLGGLWRDNGILYLGGTGGMNYSKDGGVTWERVPGDSGFALGPVLRIDEKTLVSSSFAVCHDGSNLPQDYRVYRTSEDGITWNTFGPWFSQGGSYMGFDAAHGLLYSSNCQQGFFRVKLRPNRP